VKVDHQNVNLKIKLAALLIYYFNNIIPIVIYIPQSNLMGRFIDKQPSFERHRLVQRSTLTSEKLQFYSELFYSTMLMWEHPIEL
jgi:hypothetical protein